MKQEFLYAFKLDRMTVFEVHYYTLGGNKTPHFSTEAEHFIRSKRDYDRSGQAQETLLPGHKAAYEFYKKWDPKHLHDLTDEEYEEVVRDLEELKSTYQWIYKDPSVPYCIQYFGLHDIKELTMRK